MFVLIEVFISLSLLQTVVMEEASPPPEAVAREFVRQYYTLLEKAPNFLYRFYHDESVFMHSADSSNDEISPIIGQKEIAEKIQQLNLCNCHAMVNRVDSQATLGSGIVVQVSGELSNDGQPMRRFTQTFVLASEAPKKFYVRNDIFRYQDTGQVHHEIIREESFFPGTMTLVSTSGYAILSVILMKYLFKWLRR